MCRVSGLCGFIAEFLSLFGDLMCQSIFLGWSLMGCLCFLHRKHTSASSLDSACCAVLSPALGTSSHTTLFTWKQSPALHIPTIFHSKTRLKLKSRLGYELLHSASQPAFPADNKELFFCITFLPLWPNLSPCSAFPQHISIISALFHCDQIQHILSENPQL